MSELKPTAYVETTIPSYLTSWPSSELVVAGHQQITRTWWREAATRYDLFVSQTVLDEAMQGDPAAARERLARLREVTVLPFAPDVQSLATEYLRLLHLPPKATNDAVHLAYAVVFELVYLVSWNMRHLANGLTMRRVTEYNTARLLHAAYRDAGVSRATRTGGTRHDGSRRGGGPRRPCEDRRRGVWLRPRPHPGPRPSGRRQDSRTEVRTPPNAPTHAPGDAIITARASGDDGVT